MSGAGTGRPRGRALARAAGILVGCAGAFWLGDLLGQYLTVALPLLGATAADASAAQGASGTVGLAPFLSAAVAARPLGISTEPAPLMVGLVSALAVPLGVMREATRPNQEPELGDGAHFEGTAYRNRYAHLTDEAVCGRERRPWPKPAWCERIEDDNLIVSKETMVGLTPNPIFRLKVPNMHGYMIAGSGSGKTYGFIQTNAMQLNGSAFFTDPKCENFYLLAPLYAANGYDVKFIDLRGGGLMRWSMRYNPMHYVNEMSDITELVDMLIANTTPEGPNSGDLFFTNMEKIVYTCLLGFFLFFFKRRGNEADCNIPLMLDYLAYTKETPGRMTGLELIFYGTAEKDGVVGFRQWLVEEVCGGDEGKARQRPEWTVLTMYDAFVATAKSPETMASVVSSCYARLKDFANPLVREMMSSDELCLEDFGRRKMALFAIVPDGGAGPFSFVATMALHQLFHVNMNIADSSKSRHLDIPINCYLDELANIGKLPQLDKLFATLRSRWINLYAIVQDNGQLENVYGKAARSIYSNAAITLYYGNSDLETAEQVSKEIGTHTVWYTSTSTSSGPGGRTTSVSRQHQEVPLVSAPMMYNGWLEGDQCLTHYRSSGWYLGEKPDPTLHPRWQQRCRAQAALDAEIDRLGCSSPTEAWSRLARERRERFVGAGTPDVPSAGGVPSDVGSAISAYVSRVADGAQTT